MSKTVVYPVNVEFGDCDPAGIVFFPNFLRWMDASSLNFFMSNGIPPWRELVKTHGIVGTPMLELNTRFSRPATYGETIEVHTTIEEWRAKTFVHRHVIKRGDEVLCEGTEIRAFVIHDAEAGRMKAIPVPDDIRAKCE
ncbi:MAG: acyl-CoA thioesterase [Pigmentiphaga sp.]|nr:acyl-CoA thioesterase [Pigmentiphaga sp.]